MKNVLSLFGFATLLMFSFAFTPVESTIDVCEEVCETFETVEVSTAAFFGSGKFYGCAVSSTPANVTYRLNHQGGAPSIQMAADCMPDYLTLAIGEWDLYAVADVVANVYFEWEFCDNHETASIFLPTPFNAEYVTQIYIPCP